MRIVFICGSLEAGRDGVGDYTRTLAAELIKNGHQTLIVALYDIFVSEIFDGEQQCESISVQISRIPHYLTPRQRLLYAKERVTTFSPDWLSLQFVLYAYNLKGLPFGLGALLKNLGGGKKWHIMFHELWVGMEIGSPLKYKFLGFIQKMIIKSIIKSIKPQLIHTHAKVYQVKLTRQGHNCGSLPLFTNIPINNDLKEPQVLQAEAKKNQMSMVMFGHLQHGAPIKFFADEVLLYEKEFNIKTTLIMIGVNGNEQTAWEEVWKSKGLHCTVMGKQPVETISTVFQAASIGLSTTPYLLAEKSSTIASMREHGLKILCVSRKWNTRGVDDINVPNGIYEYTVGSFKRFMNKPVKIPVGSRISEISNILAVELSLNS